MIWMVLSKSNLIATGKKPPRPAGHASRRCTSRPKVCAGGKSGASAKKARAQDRDRCGVYIGRWRPNSKLDPALRAHVAVKVMEKGKKSNRDTQHLMSMDFPYVNHFLGEFQSSRQLNVTAGCPLTIMVSSYCSGGDHFSAMHHPASASAYIIRVQAHADGQFQRFCFWNPDHPDESVNHGMEGSQNAVFTSPIGSSIIFQPCAYMCVRDPSSPPGSAPLTGIICRVEKIDDRFFSLWCSDPLCRYPYAADANQAMSSSRFCSRFSSTTSDIRCFMLVAHVEAAQEPGRPTAIKKFVECMPRPNVSFLRAFSVQLLRGLGYCHSCTLTSHNGEASLMCTGFSSDAYPPSADLRTVNIFHRNLLTAHHLLCSTPPYCPDATDPHAMLRSIKVELGDFGRAEPLNHEALNHVDFRYAAMVL